MPNKKVPVESLIILQHQLDELPARHNKRNSLIQEVANSFDVSVSTIHRALRQNNRPKLVHRGDYNQPRVTTQAEMKFYCELIAAMRLRTTNKKGRHLSIKECVRILEEYGVILNEELKQAPKDLLKRSTISRYLNRWGYDQHSMAIEPQYVPFQAEHSNECWQFDFSTSELKKLSSDDTNSVLMLASVVDDRSGVNYQEYVLTKGEDALTALRFLFNAMSPKNCKTFPFQGMPNKLYVDNGAFAKSKLFLNVMNMLDIEIIHHMPRNSDGRRTTARSKGKVERSFRTIKETFETLYHFHEPESLSEANSWLTKYLIRYNQQSHRIEEHSKIDDWIQNLPSNGYRKMCDWKKFCSFVREPESRKVDAQGCISVDGIGFQLSYEMAGQEVVFLHGVFDNEVYVEFNHEKCGPFYPSLDPIPLGVYRKSKKSDKEKQADRIGELAKAIAIPRSVLSGETEAVSKLLTETLSPIEPPSTPFSASATFNDNSFKNRVEAKTAISEFLGFPLARLSKEQMDFIDQILNISLIKKQVIADIRRYFSLNLTTDTGGSLCTEK